ncbi:hypothetical protein A5686_22165 [Mycobacterium sp. E2479]|nr:hypothetical protein A5686_22165 [Mycobacterium sp. E2479]
MADANSTASTEEEVTVMVTGEYLADNATYAGTFDPKDDVRQSLRRIEAGPFVTKHESVCGFVFDVATDKLSEVVF